MSHIDLCTLELVCARDKSVVARLRVEMRTRIDRTRIDTPYRKLRVSDLARPPVDDGDYEWAVAFAEKGDELADGSRDLTIKLKIGHGPVSGQWIKQDLSIKVRKGATVQVPFLATAPVQAEVKPQAKPWVNIDAEEARREEEAQRQEAERRERVRRSGEEAMRGAWSGMEGFFSHLGPKTPAPQPAESAVWIEIQAVLVRKRYTCAADVSRARKAVALLLHSDGSGHEIEADALARANALLDQKEAAFKKPLTV